MNDGEAERICSPIWKDQRQTWYIKECKDHSELIALDDSLAASADSLL